MEDYSRIKINRDLTNKYLVSEFYKENPNVSLTQLLNLLLEMFLDGRIIRLDDSNYEQVKFCAEKLNKTCKEVVNIVLDKLELVPVDNVEKMKMNLHKDERTVKFQKKVTVNKVTNW